VVFATQSLAHFRDPALRQIFSESCPTKIYLPNAAAAGHLEVRQAYEAAGLSPRQITRIAEAHPKKHYLLVQPDGERLIDLALSPEELAILGTSAPQAIERVMALREVDPEGWLDRWIAESTASTASTPLIPRRPTDDS
jgi:type IV secretion system protein VirB4